MDLIYATVQDLWQLALPPDTLFQDGSIRPGMWSTVAKTGTGSGSLILGNDSNPIGPFNVIVDCVLGGELNVYGIVNPSQVPQFIISLDNGVTFSPSVMPNDNGAIKSIFGGFTLQFKNGVTAPSFVIGDRYTFVTNVSPDLQRFLSFASRYVDSYLKSTYQPPYAEFGDDIVGVVCKIARWEMLKKRGMDKTQDFVIYEPKDEMQWLKDIAAGRVTPSIIEKNGQKLYPNIMVLRQPFKTVWRY